MLLNKIHDWLNWIDYLIFIPMLGISLVMGEASDSLDLSFCNVVSYVLSGAK